MFHGSSQVLPVMRQNPAGGLLKTSTIALYISLTDRTFQITANTTLGGASSPKVSWQEFTDSSGSDCGTFGSYITGYHAPGAVAMLFDAWSALRDGAWHGTLDVPLTINYATGGSPAFLSVQEYSGGFIGPVQQISLPFPRAYTYVTPCTTPDAPGTYTLRVLANGSFSIS